MIRQVAMLHLREGADGEALEAFEAALAGAHEALGARRGHLGRHIEGSVGGGDYPGICCSTSRRRPTRRRWSRPCRRWRRTSRGLARWWRRSTRCASRRSMVSSRSPASATS